MKVQFERVVSTANLPKKASELSACYDIYACENSTIQAKVSAPIRTGLKVKLPSNIEMQIRSRSGLAIAMVQVYNSPGTVDPDFDQEVKVILYNGSDKALKIRIGDRIAQAFFNIIPEVELEMVPTGELKWDSPRGGGLGSTGGTPQHV